MDYFIYKFRECRLIFLFFSSGTHPDVQKKFIVSLELKKNGAG
jgi:hypothetical protein